MPQHEFSLCINRKTFWQIFLKDTVFNRIFRIIGPYAEVHLVNM